LQLQLLVFIAQLNNLNTEILVPAIYIIPLRFHHKVVLFQRQQFHLKVPLFLIKDPELGIFLGDDLGGLIRPLTFFDDLSLRSHQLLAKLILLKFKLLHEVGLLDLDVQDGLAQGDVLLADLDELALEVVLLLSDVTVDGLQLAVLLKYPPIIILTTNPLQTLLNALLLLLHSAIPSILLPPLLQPQLMVKPNRPSRIDERMLADSQNGLA
jgi:hypothetical protein